MIPFTIDQVHKARIYNNNPALASSPFHYSFIILNFLWYHWKLLLSEETRIFIEADTEAFPPVSKEEVFTHLLNGICVHSTNFSIPWGLIFGTDIFGILFSKWGGKLSRERLPMRELVFMENVLGYTSEHGDPAASCEGSHLSLSPARKYIYIWPGRQTRECV